MSDPSAIPSTYIGMMLAMAGNTLISLSLNVQKYFHKTNMEQPEEQRTKYWKSKVWWLGMVMMATGEIGNFTAFSFAPVFLVAPLGAVSVVSNAILAYKFLKEVIRRRDIIGMIIVVIGATVLVLAAQYEEPELTVQILEEYMESPSFIIYFVLILFAVAGFMFTGTKWSYSKKYVINDIMICSLLGSITVMCSKGLSTFIRLTFQGHNMMVYFLPYALLFVAGLTVVFQVKYLNKAMETFGATEVVPVYYVCFTICSILGGIVLFREFSLLPGLNIFFFLLGCAGTFSGVYLITSKRKRDDVQIDGKTEAGSSAQTLPMETQTDGAEETPLLGGGLGLEGGKDGQLAEGVVRTDDSRRSVMKSSFQVKLWTSVQITVCVVFFISGLIAIIRGDPGQWFTLVYGLLGALLGGLGLYGAFRRNARLTRYYFRGILSLIFLLTAVGAVYAIVVAARSCEEFKIPGMTPEQMQAICHAQKATIIVPLLGLVSIALPACCFGGCAFCAREMLNDIHAAEDAAVRAKDTFMYAASRAFPTRALSFVTARFHSETDPGVVDAAHAQQGGEGVGVGGSPSQLYGSTTDDGSADHLVSTSPFSDGGIHIHFEAAAAATSSTAPPHVAYGDPSPAPAPIVDDLGSDGQHPHPQPGTEERVPEYPAEVSLEGHAAPLRQSML